MARMKPEDTGLNLPEWPIWGEEEARALCAAVDEGVWGTLGPRVMRFAGRFAGFCGAAHAILTTSGTASLEVALRALGIGYGDEVIVPLYTFAATLSAIVLVGATPVLADVEEETCVVSARTIAPLITDRTRAVIAVHLAGRPCRMEAVCALAKEHGIAVIEDAAQAHGASLGGKPVGSFGAVATFSFQSSKNLTCGEGGAIVTSSRELFTECWRYHTSGRAYEGSGEFGGRIQLGTNIRMTEWQAAILDAQMDRLEDQCKTRDRNAALLRRALGRLPFLTLPAPPDADMRHAWHLFTMNVDADTLDRDAFIERLVQFGVPAFAGYPYLEGMRFLKGHAKDYDSLTLLNTLRLSRSAIWLPGRVLLAREREMEKIALAFERAYRALEDVQ